MILNKHQYTKDEFCKEELKKVKKISKKTLCLVLLFTILMAIFMPSMVSALNYDLNDGTIINSYDISSEVFLETSAGFI